MKKLVIITMILFVGFTTEAQQVHMTSGRFSLIKETQHLVTVQELGELTSLCLQKYGKPAEWWTLSTGFEIKLLHKEDWLQVLFTCYQAIDSSIKNTTDLLKAISLSEEMIWSKETPLTKNYYWSATGKISFIDNYSGADDKVPFIGYKECPTIKRSCINGQKIIKRPLTFLDLDTNNTNEKNLIPLKEEKKQTAIGTGGITTNSQQKTVGGGYQAPLSSFWATSGAVAYPVQPNYYGYYMNNSYQQKTAGNNYQAPLSNFWATSGTIAYPVQQQPNYGYYQPVINNSHTTSGVVARNGSGPKNYYGPKK